MPKNKEMKNKEMKNKLAWFLAFVFVFFANGAQAACTAKLQDASFEITDTSSTYKEGDTINTNLSFKFTDSNAVTENKPLRVVLVMDRSASMNDKVNKKSSKMMEAKKALIAAVEKIKEGAIGSQVALVSYSTSVQIDSGFTNDFDSVIDKISKLTPLGNTAIGGALATAGAGYISGDGLKTYPGVMKSLDSDPTFKRSIIIASDGLENVPPFVADVQGTVPADVTVYSVGMGADVNEKQMKSIAKNFGNKSGDYFPVANITKLTPVLEGIIIIQQPLAGDNLVVTLEKAGIPISNSESCFYNCAPTAYLDNLNIAINETIGTIISADKKSITWTLGHADSGQIFSLPLSFLAQQAGTGVPLNKIVLKFHYIHNYSGWVFGGGGAHWEDCNLTAILPAIKKVDILPGDSTYSCTQQAYECAKTQQCGYVGKSIPVCIKTSVLKGTTEYVNASVCEANGASCGVVSETICNDNCKRNINKWKETAP